MSLAKNGQNLRLIYRSAEGQPQLLSGLASELVGMKPDVLVTGLGTVAAKAAKAVADGVPVVFMAVGDPVGANIVESLARPGGNVTGLSDLAAHIQGRRLALLREIAPATTVVAVVLNPGTPARIQRARASGENSQHRTTRLSGALTGGDDAAARSPPRQAAPTPSPFSRTHSH